MDIMHVIFIKFKCYTASQNKSLSEVSVHFYNRIEQPCYRSISIGLVVVKTQLVRIECMYKMFVFQGSFTLRTNFTFPNV